MTTPDRPPSPARGYPSARLTLRTARRAAAGEETHAEASYYLRQMAARTPMVVVLLDGEEIRGTIEWYDKGSLKITRSGKPNLLLLKHAIKYLYKDAPARGERRS